MQSNLLFKKQSSRNILEKYIKQNSSKYSEFKKKIYIEINIGKKIL